MTTIPYLKQYDNPITDYLKQYNKLLKQANPNVNELKNLLETFAVHEILIDKHDVTEDELLTHIYILNNQLGGGDPQDYGGFSEIDLRAEMRMKIAAEKATLNNFEKTMSREQLYDAKNIAWAKGLTVREIEQWRLEYDKKHPYIDMDTLREQEGWLDVYYEYDE